MKIEGKPETVDARGAPSDTTKEKPRKRFSEVLEEKRETPPFIAPLPFLPMPDAVAVDGGYSIAAPELEPLLTSLVQEIVVEAPPGEHTSVDIQFDSRTLDGLHVRIQKTGDSVDVRFSTSSESVSRLLTAHSERLAEALAQRGYVAPSVSVQPPQGSTAFFAGESGSSKRDGGSRGRHDQGRGQKRR